MREQQVFVFDDPIGCISSCDFHLMDGLMVLFLMCYRNSFEGDLQGN